MENSDPMCSRRRGKTEVFNFDIKVSIQHFEDIDLAIKVS